MKDIISINKLHFCLMIIGRASNASPAKNIIVLFSVIISAASLTLCPAMLGYAVSISYQHAESNEWKTYLSLAILAYILLWFIGQSFKYFFYTMYGFIEQKSQSQSMVESFEASTKADPRARYLLNSSEISFAIDAKASAIRETLASLYLSIIPAIVGVLVGIISIYIIGDIVDILLFIGFVVIYIAGSMPLVSRHQEYQGSFFKLSLKSFGILENFISIWREGVIFNAISYLKNKYSSDRVPVENEAINSYFWTRFLHVWQASVLTLCLGLIIFKNIIYSTESPGIIIGTVISLVGVCVSAMGPLQAVGFGISNIAVCYTRYYESEEKISPNVGKKNSSKYIIHKSSSTGSLALKISPEFMEINSIVKSTENNFLDIYPGRPAWVIGPSGSGKTTFLEGMLGISPIDVPSCSVISSPDGDIKYTYLPQNPGLFKGNAIENIDFGRNIDIATLDQALLSVGLKEFLSSSNRSDEDIMGEEGAVSGGEARRIALARALLGSKNSVIVLDEPTAGLDTKTRSKVWGLIEKTALQNIIIVTTHDDDAPIQEDDIVISVSNDK